MFDLWLALNVASVGLASCGFLYGWQATRIPAIARESAIHNMTVIHGIQRETPAELLRMSKQAEEMQERSRAAVTMRIHNKRRCHNPACRNNSQEHIRFGDAWVCKECGWSWK